MVAYLEGQEELLRVLTRAPLYAQDALARALYREANEIMKKSVRDYVPIDNGFLRGSAAVGTPVKMANGGVRVDMGYGGAAKAYAVVQHEDETLSHPPKNPRRTGTKATSRPGRAKYLKLAFDERAPKVPMNLAVSIDRMFTKRGF